LRKTKAKQALSPSASSVSAVMNPSPSFSSVFLVQPFPANTVPEALHFALEVPCSPHQLHIIVGFHTHMPACSGHIPKLLLRPCPCFSLLIVFLRLKSVSCSCAGAAPLPNTCPHGPPHQTQHRTGCVWCGETSPTRIPMPDLSVHSHQPFFFYTLPGLGPGILNCVPHKG